MKALRKQRLCSFLWGWGKWENRPCSIQKRPGISLPDRFFHFPRWKHMPPYSQFLSDSPSQGSSTYPCDREKGTAYAVPPVNLRLLPDRASSLGKRQKGQLASFPLSICGFHRTAPAVWEKRQKGQLVLSPLSIYGFHRTAPAV